MHVDFFPLFRALVEQVAAYASYFQDTRDLRALFLAAAFLLIGLAPAIFIDIARMPAKAYEFAMTIKNRQRSGRAQ